METPAQSHLNAAKKILHYTRILQPFQPILFPLSYQMDLPRNSTGLLDHQPFLK
jgi:hypothetical protein